MQRIRYPGAIGNMFYNRLCSWRSQQAGVDPKGSNNCNYSNIGDKDYKRERRVLDKGFVRVIDKLGDDLTVVNAARVSFDKRKYVYDENDRKLVRYLIKHKHFSPFRHLFVQFHIKAPEFVMRQWYKHAIGAEMTSTYCTKDTPWSEQSGRYVPVSEYYEALVYRRQSKDNKQGSEGAVKNQEYCKSIMDETMHNLIESYGKLLTAGVAKEQARMILPLSQYTQVHWTASFQAIMNFIELREEASSQYEIREYAEILKEVMHELYPEITQVWYEHHINK